MGGIAAFRPVRSRCLNPLHPFRIEAGYVRAGVARSTLLIVVASALLLSGCEQSSPDPVATPAPTAAPESTPTTEPAPTTAPPAAPEATPGPALPPLPGAGSDGQPIQTQAFSLDDYATEVASDGSRTRRGRGSESSIVSLPLGESFYVTFSVTLNFGIVQIVWSSVSDDSGTTTSGPGQDSSSSSESVASGTAQIAMDDGTVSIGPVKTAIALQIQSSDSGSRWALTFVRAER